MEVSSAPVEIIEGSKFNDINRQPHNRPLDRSVLKGKCIELYKAAIRSPHTYYSYEKRVCNFLIYARMNCDEFVALARENPTKAESILIQYAIKDKERLYEKDPLRKLSANTLINRIKPLRTLLEINDVNNINWKKIRWFLPSPKRFANDRAPTMDELRKIYDFCDMRGKAILLLLISSGIRLGALEGISVKHLEPITRDGKVIAAKLRIFTI